MVLVKVDDDFGVGTRVEAMPATFQLGAQLDVVEDFAVEDHPDGAVLVADRLVSAFDMDDAQARMRETDMRIVVKPETIGPAMTGRLDHPPEDGARGSAPVPGRSRYACKPAHCARPRKTTLSRTSAAGLGPRPRRAVILTWRRLRGGELRWWPAIVGSRRAR